LLCLQVPDHSRCGLGPGTLFCPLTRCRSRALSSLCPAILNVWLLFSSPSWLRKVPGLCLYICIPDRRQDVGEKGQGKLPEDVPGGPIDTWTEPGLSLRLAGAAFHLGWSIPSSPVLTRSRAGRPTQCTLLLLSQASCLYPSLALSWGEDRCRQETPRIR
jgi:hypothetical protein